MSASSIIVQIDDRIRLLSAILALTTWPEQEQAEKPHGVHVHARTTRTFFSEAENHLAVVIMQELLESAQPLSAIFGVASCLHWNGVELVCVDPPAWMPRQWPSYLQDFAIEYDPQPLWQRDHAAWDSAQQEAIRALEPGDPRAMLEALFGPVAADLVFQPNLCYPTADTLGYRHQNQLIAISPPPIAWGTNPPWPYDDNPADTAREAFSAYTRILVREHLDAHPAELEAARKIELPVPNTFRVHHPHWFDQFAVLFVSAATALYLREHYGKAEADAYTMMIHKANGFQALPTAIDVMERYFEAHAAGKVKLFAEYLPTFTNSFRVAEKLKKI